jgi:hypothetical protein
MDAARHIVRASEALDDALSVGTSGPARRAVEEAREAVRRMAAACVSSGLVGEREDEEDAWEGSKSKRDAETRRLKKRCEALERALVRERERSAELEREVISGRSAWFEKARRELDAALRRGQANANANANARDDEVKRMEREIARLTAVNDALREEALALEADVVKTERLAKRLSKENALLLDVTRQAQEEFMRLDRENGKATRAAASPVRRPVIQSPVSRVMRGTSAAAAPALPDFLGSPFGGVRLSGDDY